MKKILIFLVLSNSLNFVIGQDIIYTIVARHNEKRTSVDSILVENLSNDDKLLFENLPFQYHYKINLTNPDYRYVVGINSFRNSNGFTQMQNTPGAITLMPNKADQGKIIISIYDLNGQELYNAVTNLPLKRNLLKIKLGSTGLFLVNIKTNSTNQTFKVMGSDRQKKFEVNVSDESLPETYLKSSLIYCESDFEYKIGDQIRISVNKSDLNESSIVIPIVESESLNFTFHNFFTDTRDGNKYKCVNIGDQFWMAENLKFLPAVSPSNINSETEPRYYVYDYEGGNINEAIETTNYKKFGVLYNWVAAKKSCPEGWHLPTNSDWELLARYISESNGTYPKYGLDGWHNIGNHLKSQHGWSFNNDQNGNGIDDYGFNALAAGRITQSFNTITQQCTFWMDKSANSPSHAWYRRLEYHEDILYKNLTNTSQGYCVRCLKD